MKKKRPRYEPKDKRTSKKNRDRKEHLKEIVLVRRIRCTSDHFKKRTRKEI
ncbi:hypothetical protein OAY20_01485 [Candidatus Pelagibacter bacterium]|nr:hypothetical protein [Candidatus Pelagibacter bacterium]